MNLLLNKKYTRRKFLGLGLLGTLFLTGRFRLTPSDKFLTARLEEEFEHQTTIAKLHPTPEKWSDNEVTVAWLGHASFLINFFGTKILIDPALGSRIGISVYRGNALGR